MMTPDAPLAPAGRYAPSPTGDLHLGNLRTAVLAWLFARSTGRRFVIRIEDLDRQRVRPGSADRQLADLAALGIDWDGEPLYQSSRNDAYDDALAALAARGLTYECYCTRSEIAEAASAPQSTAGAGSRRPSGPDALPDRPGLVPPHAYPGTCRSLTEEERAQRHRAGHPAAIRLRADATSYSVHDVLHGDITGAVDDFVLRRGDGTAAYNLAVVVDDAAQGVDQVVRGDDLLTSAPRQAYLAALLGHAPPTYAHVPLVLGPTGARLAKRDGAVTLEDLAATGIDSHRALAMIASSLGLAGPRDHVTLGDLLTRFRPASLPREPWRFDPTPRAPIPGAGLIDG